MPKLGSASPGPNPQPLEFALELSSAGQARVSRHAYIGEFTLLWQRGQTPNCGTLKFRVKTYGALKIHLYAGR